MPIFREVDADARERLVKTSKGYQQREAYREMLGQLSDGKTMEVQPEDGETTRKLKVNVRRAANELNLNIKYGDTQEGTLLVWAEEARTKSRRGRPRKVREAADEAEAVAGL